jgi:hypothetical protein
MFQQPGVSCFCRLKLEDDWWDKMRTFSSHLMHSPWSGRTAHLPLEALREASAKYELTGQTGSLMYMAPEVYNGQPYNEKVGGSSGMGARTRGPLHACIVTCLLCATCFAPTACLAAYMCCCCCCCDRRTCSASAS